MSQPTPPTPHKFMSLAPDRRDKILNAAMSEFCKGFRHASTDTMAREAGISKGLLFHYFGTKEKLFTFLLTYAIDTIAKEFFERMDVSEPDILKRLWQATLLKRDLSYKYPALFTFVMADYTADTSDIYKTFQTDITARFFAGIDTSLFRDGIDAQKAVNIIWWTLRGYADAQIDRTMTIADYQKETERYLSELEAYFKILKSVLYKTEEDLPCPR